MKVMQIVDIYEEEKNFKLNVKCEVEKHNILMELLKIIGVC